MRDLIYGGSEYKDELIKLFPKAIITDASDEIHQDRVAIDIEIDEKEYRRIIVLNGFIEMSLEVQLFCMDINNKMKLHEEIDEWKKKYPEYFKGKE